MRGKILFISMFLLTLLSLNLVLGEIMLSQPKSTYNLGDLLEMEATIKPSQYTSLFFEMDITCGTSLMNIHKEHLTLDAGEEKQISSSLVLTRSFLGNVSGPCNVLAQFGSDVAVTQTFTISSDIEVTLTTENMTIDTEEEIVLKGTAFKENNEKVEGFVDVSVEGTDIQVTREVKEGIFETNFSFPSDTVPESYVLRARVYEKSQGQETNSGEATITLNIKKKPTKLEIAISEQSIKPGQELVFKPIIYDQANGEMGGEISVRVYDPFDGIPLQKIMKSGQEEKIQTATNQSYGYWRIEAKALDLETKRLFYIEEMEKVTFNLVNNTLIIENIGNVVYSKAVQISIGETTEIKTIGLDLGQTKKFRLLAPEGKYTVRVSDGTDELEEGAVSLTGRVTGVEDIGKVFSFSGRYPVIWLFVIAVFGLFILLLASRILKKRFYVKGSYGPAKKEKTLEKKGESKGKKSKEKGKIKTGKVTGLHVPEPSPIEKAEHSLVLKGKKESSGIVTVKLKDLVNLRKTSLETVNNIERKGVVYETGDCLIGIFSSPTTKTFKNDVLAVKVSEDIGKVLREHNKKAEDKIIYGVALNSGNLILEKGPHKLRFTSIGNTLNLGRRIASLSRGEILMSEEMQKRIAGQVRLGKEIRQELNVYRVKGVIDRNRNKSFIQDFLKRQEKGLKRK